MSTGRVERVLRILRRECPYRVSAKKVRRIAAVLHSGNRPEAQLRSERFIAACAALPFRLAP